MAITWDFKITPISLQNKTASIEATRTDDTDPDNPMVYTLPKEKLGTQPQQAAALDEIWAKHQAALDLDAQVREFLDGLEAQGKANLEARET